MFGILIGVIILVATIFMTLRTRKRRKTKIREYVKRKNGEIVLLESVRARYDMYYVIYRIDGEEKSYVVKFNIIGEDEWVHMSLNSSFTKLFY